MGTAELHVEQVLIGALVVAAVMVPWSPEIVDWVTNHGGAIELVTGAIAIGASYLVGIVFDRLADTLTEGLERHQRLRTGLSQRCRGNRDEWRGRPWSDPYPEDVYRMRALNAGETVVAWINYHRSRVRLSRALALYLPALTWSTVIGLGRFRNVGAPELHLAWVPWLTMAAALIPSAMVLSVLPKKWREICVAPRTDRKRAALRYAIRCGYIDSKSDVRRLTLAAAFCSNPALLAGGAMLGLSIGLACILDSVPALSPRSLPAAIAGTILSILALWTWWRISNTYRAYLRHVGPETAARQRQAIAME